MKKNYSFLIIFFLLFSYSFSQISTFPYSNSFENASDLGTTANDGNTTWTSATSGSLDGVSFGAASFTFTRNTGSTPSGGTGPSAALGGTAGSYYIYTEASTGAPQNSNAPLSSGDIAELMAKFDFIDDPKRISEENANGPFYEVIHDFVLSRHGE